MFSILFGLVWAALIRLDTCGNSDCCDYCVVGSDKPLVEEYEIVTDKLGFLVSRKKAGSRSRTERTVQ